MDREKQSLEDIDYADDLALVAEDVDNLLEKTTRLSRKAKGAGLKISVKTTKIMRIGTQDEQKIVLEGKELKDLEEFVYLGSKISKSGGSEEFISARINKAGTAFMNLGWIWRSNI
jgi:hypothetical protein